MRNEISFDFLIFTIVERGQLFLLVSLEAKQLSVIGQSCSDDKAGAHSPPSALARPSADRNELGNLLDYLRQHPSGRLSVTN